jgi:predicted CopG family antitoxin
MSMCMGIRTIAVSDQVYERLRALKRPDESYSKLLDRIAGRSSLMDLAGVTGPDQVQTIRKSVEDGRARSRARRERMPRG